MKVLVVLAIFAAAATALPQNGLRTRHIFVNPKQIFPMVNLQPSIDSRVVNGQEVVPNSIPYQVWLRFTGPEMSWHCGGSLISENFILTAGHCGDGALKAMAVMGAHNINKIAPTEQTILIKNIIVHPGYDSDAIAYDIGLVELKTPVTLNEFIQPAVLPTRADVNNSYVGEPCRISGWGLTEGHGMPSDVLLYADSVVISNEECNKTFGIVQDYQMCMSGENLSSACSGDSGGPLAIGDVVVGVVSYAVRNCIVGTPSAFTRVNSFLDWIEENSDVVIA